MPGLSKFAFAAVAILFAAQTLFHAPAHARGTGTHVNDAKYYGPVYGWRYSPPPAKAAVEHTCSWTTVRAVRNGHSVMRRMKRCD